jgi:hypothetical protein
MALTPKCEFCGKEVDPSDKTNWHRVSAWRKNSGGSAVLFPEGPYGHACGLCIQEKKMGVRTESLF